MKFRGGGGGVEKLSDLGIMRPYCYLHSCLIIQRRILNSPEPGAESKGSVSQGLCAQQNDSWQGPRSGYNNLH